LGQIEQNVLVKEDTFSKHLGTGVVFKTKSTFALLFDKGNEFQGAESNREMSFTLHTDQ